jgi:hypothetical protein
MQRTKALNSKKPVTLSSMMLQSLAQLKKAWVRDCQLISPVIG